MTAQIRPPMPYFGGKITLGPQIAALLPAHRHYVEPFCGSLAVLLAKPPSRMETVNDLDQAIVTFWRVLRERPADLIRVCALTPHSRVEYQDSVELDATDDLELARQVWVKLTQGRTGRLRRTGWRHYIDPGATSVGMPAYLDGYVDRMAPVVERLHRVSLEARPALDLIERYGVCPDVLLYVDPPYLGTTRAQDNAYRCEMRTEAEHRELAGALRAARASVVLSGYPSDLYDRELYPDWHRVSMPAGTGQGGEWANRTEVLWSNRPLRTQLDLFTVSGGGYVLRLRLVPVTRDQAFAFIAAWHRHHPAPVGNVWAVGVASSDQLVGVAVAGRPISRHWQDGLTCEVTRVAVTDGVPNACSMLYGACWRAAKAMGYARVLTYTQTGESGASLRAAGWLHLADRPPRGGWDMPGRHRVDRHPTGVSRHLWGIGAWRWTADGRVDRAEPLAPPSTVHPSRWRRMTPAANHPSEGSTVSTSDDLDGQQELDVGQTKPFAATLQEIAGGSVHARLSEQLQTLVNAVTDTGKKGTLTLQLVVAPLKPGNVSNLVVTAKTQLKAPEGEDATPSSVFFHDNAGNLRRDDPKQPALPIRGLDNRRSASA